MRITLEQFNGITGELKVYSNFTGELVYQTKVEVDEESGSVQKAGFIQRAAIVGAIRKAERIAADAKHAELRGQIYSLLGT